MVKDFLQYFDFKYYLRFLALFFLFYIGYTFVIAAAAPTGTYFPFVDKFLNFPALIRYCVLHIGQALLGVLGYQTFVTEDRIVSSDGHSILQMAWPCYGLAVKSLWVAFICAHKMPVNKKIYWSIGGVVAIFILNCIRVAVLMISMIEKWKIADYLGTNAHDLFNYLCYLALIGLVLLFYAKTKSPLKRSNIVPSFREA